MRSIDANPAHFNSIKSIDRKLTRLQFNLDKVMLRNAIKNLNESQSGVEEIFADISSKVDALYEKATSEAMEDPHEVRHLGKSCKILVAPYKKLLTTIDSLQSIVKEVGLKDEIALGGKGGELRSSVMSEIRDSLESIIDEIKSIGRKNEKNIDENERILRRIDKKLDNELEDDDEDDEKLKKSLKKYIIEQRKTLEKNIKKMFKSKNDDEDDDSDSDDDDDKKKSKKRGKSKGDDDDDDDDDTDDDDDDDDDNSEDDKKKSKKRGKSKDDDDDDDSDDSDDDDDDDIICDDSDENGSKSCEKEKKKAYSRGKKNFKYENIYNLNNDYDDDKLRNPEKNLKKTKVRKSLKEPENIQDNETGDILLADQPYLDLGTQGVSPQEIPRKPSKLPDTTP